MTSPADTKEWKALSAHVEEGSPADIRTLFKADPDRFARFSLEHDGLLLDYSKNRITDETMRLLMDLAGARDVEAWRDRMFSGKKINNTEDRAVLHTALRAPEDASVEVNGENVVPFVQDVLTRMQRFSDAVRSGSWTGYTGKRIKTVVNIGIGGSDLGPRAVCAALETYTTPDLSVRFVSNVDGADITAVLKDCDPETTLFLVASKTFITLETMANAHTAKNWLVSQLKDEVAVQKHFAALSTNEDAVRAFGIDPENMFPFRDWVGGRYSVWSAIGLSVCMAAGFENFRAFLDGAQSMDRHFREAPLEKNMPVILALLGLWYRNFQGAQSYAVLPYDTRLGLFPGWLQQLDMESNGKSVDRDGQDTDYDTGPIVFGIPGTDFQHSFAQLIHQGTSLIPCDFIAAVGSDHDLEDQHKMLLANMVAQSQALMQGRTLEEAGGDPQKVFTGNRPSNTILLEKLDPYRLGMLLALYEHKVFVQGILWNLNSFDQWGVELGKVLTGGILPVMDSGAPEGADSSTAGILGRTREKI